MNPAIFNIRTEYKFNPLGMDEPFPRFSYEFSDGVQAQQERKIIISEDATGEIVWDSGWIPSGLTCQLAYAGKPLQPFTRYDIAIQAKIQTVDGEDAEVTNDRKYWFETGFMNTAWQGKWIAAANSIQRVEPAPVQHFFRDFCIKPQASVVQARLYATALGSYDPLLNGEPITDYCLMPGWTDYCRRVQYQAFDITDKLADGMNNLEIRLAEGWFHGLISNYAYQQKFGQDFQPMLKCELHILYDDNSREIIGSDNQFCNYAAAFASPFRYSDLYHGEWYEAFKDEHWRKNNHLDLMARTGKCREISGLNDLRINWNAGAPVTRIDELTPQKITRNSQGTYIIDFGQNLTGREKITLRNTRRGTTIVIKHGEMLNPDGSLYCENTRNAWATTIYSTGHNRLEKYEPTFTYYGFRYLEISGWPGELTDKDISAVVLSSQLDQTGDFFCANEQLNRLYSNIVWSQCGNFVDIPSDCPQRDERLGWTGDAQIFSDIATYNMNCADFYTKWLTDLNSCQYSNGSYPDFAPNFLVSKDFSTGWADAGIIVPWRMFEKYADTRILDRFFPQMMKYIRGQNSQTNINGLLTCAKYGDWMNVEDDTSREYLATAYHLGMLDIMLKIARILKKQDEGRELYKMRQKMLEIFQLHFLDGKGIVVEDSQTALLLALHFNLIPVKAEKANLNKLIKAIKKRDTHLSTGFLGTPLLLAVLSKYGQIDLAYDLLLQNDYPGWLFQVTQGATTIWERWNSYSATDGFGDISMNSFNHCAFGAVGNWFFRTICGIVPDSSSPATAGFKHFILAPKPGKKLKSAEASYCSSYGPIISSWKRTASKLTWDFFIPGNTTATIIPPSPNIISGAEDLIRGYDGSYTAGPGQYRLIMN